MAERTKLWIAEKMKEMMKKEPLSQIRISAICDEAEIDRSTFYYHFQDKYDLVAWIYLHTVLPDDLLDVYQCANHLKQMKNEYLFYKNAYDDYSQNALWKFIFEYYVQAYTQLVKEKLSTDELDPLIAFSIRSCCYGSVWTTRDWILENSSIPAETLVRMQFESLPQSLREILEL